MTIKLGKIDLVKQILAHLYKYLKLLIGANKPISRMLPVPFDKLLEYDAVCIYFKVNINYDLG